MESHSLLPVQLECQKQINSNEPAEDEQPNYALQPLQSRVTPVDNKGLGTPQVAERWRYAASRLATIK
jgi:hypothetical protein